jgi:hypothetical protein
MLADTSEKTRLDGFTEPKEVIARPNGKRVSSTPKTDLPQAGNTDACGETSAAKPDRSKWESGDQYPGALFAVPGTNWRVAVCAKGYCWMLQQREGRDRWISRKFFATKKRLAVVLTELVGDRAFRAVKAKVDELPT